MGTPAVGPPLAFAPEQTYARDVPELVLAWRGAAAPAPELLVLNEALASELGADPALLAGDEGVRMLAGSGVDGLAMAYAGHQFGSYSPRLGDGRALLLGEVVGTDGTRRDVHLKGSGRTPFARGGDGRAAVGPMLREVVVGEAMHALGIPTTRALAVVATGEPVYRETALPGAVLARVAASHLRVGTFQYAARLEDPAILRRLSGHAIARHHPAAAQADVPALALFEAVVDAQARLVAQWMLVGFVHGVMNTDNVTISGETIDYGPCAFMEAFDPATVFSSIDAGGRYAYGNQPVIAQWDLARLAEALLPLIDEDDSAAIEAATAVLGTFPERYGAAWRAGMRTKLGLLGEQAEDLDLARGLLELLHAQRVDHTLAFRELSGAIADERAAVRDLFADREAFDAWASGWRARLARDGREHAEVAAAMDAVNPLVIPRNHLVEEALTQATAGDLEPFGRLLEAVRRPFVAGEGLERYAQPAPETFGRYRTFCGT